METKTSVEFDDKAIQGLEILLHEFWILRDKNPGEYQLVREREKVLRRYLDDKFGLLLIVHQHFIKLEKIPVEPEPWMGIPSFQEQRDYALFSYAMAFLEDKTVGEQFLLSELSEEIRHEYAGEEGIDWTVYTHRKSLIRTIKTMTDLHLIQTVDGNIQRFDTDEEHEVLYETTVYSKYFIRSFPEDLTMFTGWQDLLKEDWRYQQEDERRKRVYRQLFFSPGMHRGPENELDFAYIRNFRNRMMEDIEKHTHYQLRLFKNTAFLSSMEPNYRYDYYPSNKAVTDILLQLSYHFHQHPAAFVPSETGELLLTRGDFDGILLKLKEKNGSGWSKYFRDASIDAVRRECLGAMESWMMAETDDEGDMIYIKPLFGILAGKYPDDYKEKGEDHE
ncbi:TIGR02678 family protein [Rossellomorea sp. RS05]|uniref:TIGR02678 family protein n=1 Tax=Rossellomorea sp. RS05 TaxID=3149166 RepID=UPI002570882C